MYPMAGTTYSTVESPASARLRWIFSRTSTNLPRSEANLRFLELLESLPRLFGARIHAHVLIGNHYHLQIETPEANRQIILFVFSVVSSSKIGCLEPRRW